MLRIETDSPALLGRARELELLSVLIGSARNGRGGALVVRGEAGIGKTALLGAAVQHAQGLRIVRADGYEVEAAMPYAALQRLGTPFRDHLAELPQRQVAALRIAAGLDGGPPPDRFLVGLGMLSLFAAAGESEPIVCVVDDAHLLDTESLEVLAFVARRLEAESLALILATRPDERTELVTAGVARLELAGLDTLSAVHLLNRFAAEPLDPYVAARIAQESVGNPLTLIDLGREVSAQDLTAFSLAPAPVPVGARLEAHYQRQVDALPASAGQWLRLAAVESSGDVALIDQAAGRLRLPRDAAVGAEQFATITTTVRFRHPLVRSAIYNGMPAPERRRLHEALRDVAEENGRLDLAVWHAAAAVAGTDEAVAARMVLAADKAGGRGGTASRARLLARAADLTPAGALRDLRLIEAAEAAASAGAAQLALGFLDRIDPTRLDPVGQGRVLSLRALLALFVGEPAGVAGAAATLLQAASLFHGIVPELEERTLLRAFELALPAEWAMEGVTLHELGQRLQDGAHSVLRRALAAHILRPYAEAVPHLRAAVQVLRDTSDDELLDLGTLGIALTTALWDERAGVELLERMARVAREAGALRVLDSALWLLSLTEVVRGDLFAAGRYIGQVRDLRQAIGYDAEQVVNVPYLAWSGAPKAQVEAIAEATRTSGFGGVWTLAMMGLGVREIAEGHYRDAFERFRPMVERPFIQVTYQQLPDFIEAGVRSGHIEAVRPSAAKMMMFAAASGTPWVRGLAARSAALLAPADEAEDLYRSAIKHLQESTARGDHGRAHLLYGEWLRRERRRRDARDELRTALGIFEKAGAPAFADRARRELEATGEHVPREAPIAGDGFTPQESAIAHLAAEGQTNAEIAAALFISPNTVDYHLRKVFRKLEVTSRRQLGDRLATQ